VKPLGPPALETPDRVNASSRDHAAHQLDRRCLQLRDIRKSRAGSLHTRLPARGIANGLLRGAATDRSRWRVIAAEDPKYRCRPELPSLIKGVLARRRTYLDMLPKINDGRVFLRSWSGGNLVMAYEPVLSHDLSAVHCMCGAHQHALAQISNP